jgi:PX domain
VGFKYSCFINGALIPESTSKLAHFKECFKVELNGTINTVDRAGQPIVWYILQATRVEDSVTTTVHRRFRDFAELNSQVKQNLKGHHLRTSLPLLPEKLSKITTDHTDPAFLESRYTGLEIFIKVRSGLLRDGKLNCRVPLSSITPLPDP